MRVKNNVILVTGGTSGIGLAIAQAFLDLQNTVIVCGRDEQKLAQVRQEYPTIHAIKCDITKEDEVRHLLSQITSEHEGFNLLINNAGIQYNYHLADSEATLEKIEREIDINFLSLVRLTKLCLPTLMKQPEAAIVNVSSGTGIVPKPNGAVYSATKAAVHSFSTALRWQLENSGIKVFELLPPVVDTKMTHGRDEAKLPPEAVAHQLVREMQQDRYEIKVGKIRLLSLINRVSPALAARIMKRQSS